MRCAPGVVIVCGGQVTIAIDLYTDRKLRYGIKDGGPDPATLQDDTKKLTEMVKATMQSWHGRKMTPVYQLLPNLQEPDWKSLRIGDVREFWERHDAWEDRVVLARKVEHIGDALMLADKAPVAAFRAEAWIRAGEASRKDERFDFAPEQLERGLEIEPGNLKGQREKGICLQRLALAGAPGHSLDRAREHYRNVWETRTNDLETWALLGRVDNDAWAAAWPQADKTQQQMHDEAADEDALLRAAIDSYAKGYRNPSHYYSGINALTLMHLHHHLTADARYDREMATLGDLEVLVDTPNSVKTAYQEAIVNNDKDWFALNSSSAQLQMLKDLGFRPENVDAGIATFDRALQKLTQPADQWQPRQMFLSRHMAHQRSYDRNLKANTGKTRPDSLFRQGCMLYELIATMPAARLTPLMRRFGEMLLEQRLFSQMFSVV